MPTLAPAVPQARDFDSLLLQVRCVQKKINKDKIIDDKMMKIILSSIILSFGLRRRSAILLPAEFQGIPARHAATPF